MDELPADYETGRLRFNGVFEIESTETARAFAQGGDSGSLVVTRDGEGAHAVGLVFAVSETGGRNGEGLAYAIPMRTVLNRLGVRLLT